MNQTLQTKNCLITGATGGLGIEIAKEFAKNGCNLFLTGQNKEKLIELKKEIELEQKNIKIEFETADLTNTEDIQEMIKKSKETFSNIDILVNCAGIFPVNLISDSTVNDFEKCFDINVKAAFILCKEFSQEMISNKWGRIVNIGSSSSYQGFKNTSVYCSSKHALLGLSRSLHAELKEFNVRTFCVSPGPIKTPMGEKIIKNENPNEKFDSFMNPKEIAEFIVYLISFDKEMVSEEVRLSRIN